MNDVMIDKCAVTHTSPETDPALEWSATIFSHMIAQLGILLEFVLAVETLVASFDASAQEGASTSCWFHG